MPQEVRVALTSKIKTQKIPMVDKIFDLNQVSDIPVHVAIAAPGLLPSFWQARSKSYALAVFCFNLHFSYILDKWIFFLTTVSLFINLQ